MNKYYISRLGLAFVIALLSVLAFLGIFYSVKIFDVQLTALLQRVLVHPTMMAGAFFIGIIVLTLIFGRIYCSTLCPLGLYQELLTLIFRRKYKPSLNTPYKYFIMALTFGTLVGGTAFLIRYIDPYTLFGSAMSGAILGLVFLVALTFLVWFKGRLFCAHICPVGAFLGLLSRFSLFKIYIENDKCVSCGMCASKCPTGSIDFKNKTVNNETCIKCFRCMTGCKRSGIHYGIKQTKSIPTFNPSRRQFLISGAVLGVFALAYKGGIDLSKAIAAKIKKVIVPAGASSAEEFANHCLNCNLCVKNCPMKILKKANSEYPVVHIDYSESFCDYNCHKCSEVCPSGAIKHISLTEKQKTQIGLASIDENRCVKCGLCVMKCPREAITKENGKFPIVNTDMCIGCGACQNACPVKAITVTAVDKQRIL